MDKFEVNCRDSEKIYGYYLLSMVLKKSLNDLKKKKQQGFEHWTYYLLVFAWINIRKNAFGKTLKTARIRTDEI
jgi:hypothetical protein